MALAPPNLTDKIRNTDLISRLEKLIEWRNLPDAGLSPRLEAPEIIRQLPTFLSPIKQTIDDLAWETIKIVTERSRLTDQMISQNILGFSRPYSPRLYETMFNEAARLLNRCEAYRREADAAAAQAIRESFDLVTRESQLSNQRARLDISAPSAISASSDRAEGYQTASETFSAGPDALSQGHAQQAGTESSFISAGTKIDEKRIQLDKFSLDIQDEYNNAIRMQQQAAGGVLNNVERYQRVSHLFQADLDEAYERLIAAERGLKSVSAGKLLIEWVVKNPLPREEERIFDRLIEWVRHGLRTIDAFSLSDQEFIFPVVLGAVNRDPGLSETLAEASIARDALANNNYVSRELAAAALKKGGNGTISFTIREGNLPNNLDAFRLRSIGVGYLAPEDKAEKPLEQTRRLAISVTLPQQVSRGPGNHGSIFRETIPEISLGLVGMVTRDGASSESGGAAIAYASPLGEWKITIQDSGVYASGIFDRDITHITGLIVYLRLMARGKQSIPFFDAPRPLPPLGNIP